MTRTWISSLYFVAILATTSAIVIHDLQAQTTSPTQQPGLRPSNQIIVSPNGPEDGGDFGPKTPGTRTSGLQEAFDAAKNFGKDLFVAGGSWTANKTEPVVYNLQESLRIPWMQNFRFDSGHAVLNYVGSHGAAVIIDSQMSCHYRFGLIVSVSDGTVVHMNPTTAGPDRFQVVTSTEFVFNAIVGGGGAWPGGEAYNSDLDENHKWIGVGLHLDGTVGAIDGNKITVIETVGCANGLLLTGRTTRNTIEETNIHLCSSHIQIGNASDAVPCDNRIEAFLDCQGIKPSSGVQLFSSRNMLTLSLRPGMSEFDIRIEPSASDNLILLHSPSKVDNRALGNRNRLITAARTPFVQPELPASGELCQNMYADPMEIIIIEPGIVNRWKRVLDDGEEISFEAPLHGGQSIFLAPGESIAMHYSQPPRWKWRHSSR